MNYNWTYADYTVNKLYNRDGNLSGINFILNEHKFFEKSGNVRSVSLIYAVNEQKWFAELPFNDGAIAIEPGRAFAIARSMNLEDKVAEILKEEGL